MKKIFEKLISEELLAYEQYKLFARWYKFNNYKRLISSLENTAKDEEEHIDELIDMAWKRNIDIKIFLPNDLKLKDNCESIESSGLTPDNIISKVVILEDAAIESYREAIELLKQDKEPDEVVIQLFKHILEEEENHKRNFNAELFKLTVMSKADFATTLITESQFAKYKKYFPKI